MGKQYINIKLYCFNYKVYLADVKKIVKIAKKRPVMPPYELQ